MGGGRLGGCQSTFQFYCKVTAAWMEEEWEGLKGTSEPV